MPMKLYNVTFCLEDDRTVLEPAIPETVGDGEDNTISRVCFADSVAHCMQALASSHKELEEGVRFLVREVEMDENDSHLVSPKILRDSGLVPDALENNEYWYKQPVECSVFLCSIKEIECSFEIAWTCIPKDDCIEIVSKYAPETLFLKAVSSEEAYDIFYKWCNQFHKWEEMDYAWEELAELPWAQLIKVSNFEYEVLEKLNYCDIER